MSTPQEANQLTEEEMRDIARLRKLEQQRKLLKELLPGYEDGIAQRPTAEACQQTSSLALSIESEDSEDEDSDEDVNPSAHSETEGKDEAYVMPDSIGIRFSQDIRIIFNSALKRTTVQINPETMELEEILLFVRDWPTGEVVLVVGGYQVFPKRAPNLPSFVEVTTEYNKFYLEDKIWQGLTAQDVERERAAWRQRERENARGTSPTMSTNPSSFLKPFIGSLSSYLSGGSRFRRKTIKSIGEPRSHKTCGTQTDVSIDPYYSEDESEEAIIRHMSRFISEGHLKELLEDESEPSTTVRFASDPTDDKTPSRGHLQAIACALRVKFERTSISDDTKTEERPKTSKVRISDPETDDRANVKESFQTGGSLTLEGRIASRESEPEEIGKNNGKLRGSLRTSLLRTSESAKGKRVSYYLGNEEADDQQAPTEQEEERPRSRTLTSPVSMKEMLMDVEAAVQRTSEPRVSRASDSRDNMTSMTKWRRHVSHVDIQNATPSESSMSSRSTISGGSRPSPENEWFHRLPELEEREETVPERPTDENKNKEDMPQRPEDKEKVPTGREVRKTVLNINVDKDLSWDDNIGRATDCTDTCEIRNDREKTDARSHNFPTREGQKKTTQAGRSMVDKNKPIFDKATGSKEEIDMDLPQDLGEDDTGMAVTSDKKDLLKLPATILTENTKEESTSSGAPVFDQNEGTSGGRGVQEEKDPGETSIIYRDLESELYKPTEGGPSEGKISRNENRSEETTLEQSGSRETRGHKKTDERSLSEGSSSHKQKEITSDEESATRRDFTEEENQAKKNGEVFKQGEDRQGPYSPQNNLQEKREGTRKQAEPVKEEGSTAKHSLDDRKAGNKRELMDFKEKMSAGEDSSSLKKNDMNTEQKRRRTEAGIWEEKGTRDNGFPIKHDEGRSGESREMNVPGETEPYPERAGTSHQNEVLGSATSGTIEERDAREDQSLLMEHKRRPREGREAKDEPEDKGPGTSNKNGELKSGQESVTRAIAEKRNVREDRTPQKEHDGRSRDVSEEESSEEAGTSYKMLESTTFQGSPTRGILEEGNVREHFTSQKEYDRRPREDLEEKDPGVLSLSPNLQGGLNTGGGSMLRDVPEKTGGHLEQKGVGHVKGGEEVLSEVVGSLGERGITRDPGEKVAREESQEEERSGEERLKRTERRRNPLLDPRAPILEVADELARVYTENHPEHAPRSFFNQRRNENEQPGTNKMDDKNKQQ